MRSQPARTGSTSCGGFLAEARAHLSDNGGLLCEIGRCRPALEESFPDTNFLWLDTAESSGEVFWLPAAALE